MIRVAFITHYTDLYGANRSLLDLIDGLRLNNVSSYVLVPEYGAITDALTERGVPFEILPLCWSTSVRDLSCGPIKKTYRYIKWRCKSIKRLFQNLYLLPGLLRRLKQWDVDIIYTNTALISLGLIAALTLRRPHIWHLREFIDLDYRLSHDWGKAFFKYLLRLSDANIAISEAVHSHLVDESASKKTHTIYNGIAFVEKFEELYNIEHSPGEKVVKPYTFALVGLIHPAKGQTTAIRALSLVVEDFPDVQLLIVGGGNIESLKLLVSSLKLSDNIQFWGRVDNVYSAYLASNAVLMCSRNEAMGRVTVEAMSACRPVIGFDNAGTSEIIRHEQTGLLYEGGYRELAICMKRFIDNPTWAQQLGENAWKIAREKYCVESYTSDVYNVLKSVLMTETNNK